MPIKREYPLGGCVEATVRIAAEKEDGASGQRVVFVNCNDQKLSKMIMQRLQSHSKNVKFVDSEEEADLVICDCGNIVLYAPREDPRRRDYFLLIDEPLPKPPPSNVTIYHKDAFLNGHRFIPFCSASE